MHLLTISGSLRTDSTNAALLRSLGDHAPPDVRIEFCDDLRHLPIFNPDDEGEHTPDTVLQFAIRVAECDGLIVSSPEYAHGIPGGLKNALDWLVSRTEIVDKPVLLIHASHRGDIALTALLEVLKTISANTVPEVTVRLPLIGKTRVQANEIIAAPETGRQLREVLREFAIFIDKLALTRCHNVDTGASR